MWTLIQAFAIHRCSEDRSLEFRCVYSYYFLTWILLWCLFMIARSLLTSIAAHFAFFFVCFVCLCLNATMLAERFYTAFEPRMNILCQFIDLNSSIVFTTGRSVAIILVLWPHDCSNESFCFTFVLFVILLSKLDPVKHCDHLIWDEGVVLWLCAVCYVLFAHPLSDMGRLWINVLCLPLHN